MNCTKSKKIKGVIMKHTALTISALIISAIFFLPLSAMGQDTPYYFVIKAGVYSPSDDLDDDDFDTGFNGEIALGYYFNPNFAMEGGIGYFQTEASFRRVYPSIGPARQDVDIVVVPVTVTAKGIIPFQDFECYGGGGIGFYFANAENNIMFDSLSLSDSDEDSSAVFGYHLLMGINFNITKNVFFGIEGKHFWTKDAQFKSTFFAPPGVPVRITTNLNGYTITGNFGIRY